MGPAGGRGRQPRNPGCGRCRIRQRIGRAREPRSVAQPCALDRFGRSHGEGRQRLDPVGNGRARRSGRARGGRGGAAASRGSHARRRSVTAPRRPHGTPPLAPIRARRGHRVLPDRRRRSSGRSAELRPHRRQGGGSRSSRDLLSVRLDPQLGFPRGAPRRSTGTGSVHPDQLPHPPTRARPRTSLWRKRGRHRALRGRQRHASRERGPRQPLPRAALLRC